MRKTSLSSNNLINEEYFEAIHPSSRLYFGDRRKSGPEIEPEVPFLTNSQTLALKFIRIIQFRVARRKFKEALR